MTSPAVLPLRPRAAFAAAIASGLLYFLAFAGMDIWPLAFVAFVPLWIALVGQTPRRSLLLGLATGTTMNMAGFHWLLGMLKTFSGFPTALCLVFMTIICAYQGGRFALLGWLHGRATARGWPSAIVLPAAFVASELAYPLLFPWYSAAMVHDQPVLLQVADLGGPIAVGLVLLGANMALTEPLLAKLERRAIDRRVVVLGAGALGLSLVYGAVRVHQIDAAANAAEAVHVGLVQGNMGLMQKRHDPTEGLRRHQKLTEELKEKGAELVVWSESSVTFAVPEPMMQSFMRDRVAARLGVPTIFGAVLFRSDPDRERWFNTALATDERGQVTSRYDKQFLLAFGEYLPLGDTFPILYKWSPNSGKFSPGKSLEPLLVPVHGRTHKVTTLICYEDIIPSFTNAAVSAADPELLVNMTNDAWFGDTSEPWEHLALAQLRAVEHHRYLLRSTNSGVSAVVDPVGRVVTHGKTFDVEGIDAVVHWMNAKTVYEVIGDGLWYLLTLAVFVAAFRRRSSIAAPKQAIPVPAPVPALEASGDDGSSANG